MHQTNTTEDGIPLNFGGYIETPFSQSEKLLIYLPPQNEQIIKQAINLCICIFKKDSDLEKLKRKIAMQYRVQNALMFAMANFIKTEKIEVMQDQSFWDSIFMGVLNREELSRLVSQDIEEVGLDFAQNERGETLERILKVTKVIENGLVINLVDQKNLKDRDVIDAKFAA